MVIEERNAGEVTVIVPRGRITMAEGSAVFRDKINDLAHRGRTKIVLNANEVTYIDSTGIGELVSAVTTLGNRQGAIRLVFLNKRVRDLLQITKLDTCFGIYDSEEEAIRSFNEFVIDH